MQTYHIPAAFVLILSLIMLSACTAGPGYNATRWEYKPDLQGPAQKDPDPLGEIYKRDGVLGPDQSAASEELLRSDKTEGKTTLTFEEKARRETLPPVKVALLIPLSGKHSELGQSMFNASQIALFDVGHNAFELMPRDTQGTPEGAKQAAREVIEEGAQLILGPVFAESVRAVKERAKHSDIPVLAFSTDWTQAGPNTFLMGFLPFGQVERIISYAAGRGIQNIGVLAPQDNYGDAALQAYQSAAIRAGINTVEITRLSGSSRNIDIAVEQFARYQERQQSVPQTDRNILLPSPYDAIFIPAGGDNLRSISNLASKYGLRAAEVRRLGTGLWDDPGLRFDKSLSGGWFAAPSPKLRKDFEARYEEIYGKPPLRLATLSYDATALAAILAQTGLQKSGSPAFNTAALTNPNGFIGIDGIFRFRPDGLVERGLAVMEFRNNRTVIIDEAPQSFQNFRPNVKQDKSPDISQLN